MLSSFVCHIRTPNNNGPTHFSSLLPKVNVTMVWERRSELAFKNWPGSTEGITLLSRPAPTEFCNGCKRYLVWFSLVVWLEILVPQQEVLCVRHCAWLLVLRSSSPQQQLIGHWFKRRNKQINEEKKRVTITNPHQNHDFAILSCSKLL